MFRLKKEDKVEVFSKREVPSGSWLRGTIMSGNGHTYYILYESQTGVPPIVEKVSRKAIRPFPHVESSESWAAGEFVQGVESEAGNQMSHIDSSRTLKRGSPSTSTHGAGKKSRAIEKEGFEREAGNQMSHMGSSRTLKRGSTYGARKKLRAIEKEGRLEGIVAVNGRHSTGFSEMDKKEVLYETRKLALDAYHRTMESLGASGYISWEQEEMLTDLRLKLNISNEEHLMELRKLVSA